ncbi:hypothetical protein SeMB42_g03104 [Synchytrium endobioticum]|uniref:DUF599 domain-containing protein n=1 Tax=Synchytrium endobioticum TaxID=286115 RepID=A0A507DBH3_9FUNG|nr:hypothetical protein SeLEV6574_g06317 [Synchytrium endobioticum]TPX48178.1 hypothetical protein SeMB42_g03104 [Synchytrium endobioticum]
MSDILPDVPIIVGCVALYISYHGWLIRRITISPLSTVIGITRLSRKRWVAGIVNSNGSLGILAIQTLRNYLMMSSMLATVAITLAVGIMAVVATLSKSTKSDTQDLQFLGGWDLFFKIKVAVLMATFVCAFVCFMEAMRYMNHAGFLMTGVNLKASPDDGDKAQDVKAVSKLAAKLLNQGGLFHTFGTRFLLFCFPVLAWLFSPWALLALSTLLVALFFLLDQESSAGFGHASDSARDEPIGADRGDTVGGVSNGTGNMGGTSQSQKSQDGGRGPGDGGGRRLCDVCAACIVATC